MSMYITTKTLPKASQLRIQKQISKVVLDAEEELLESSLRPPSSCTAPSIDVSSLQFHLSIDNTSTSHPFCHTPPSVISQDVLNVREHGNPLFSLQVLLTHHTVT
jgi:hypothetical protein